MDISICFIFSFFVKMFATEKLSPILVSTHGWDGYALASGLSALCVVAVLLRISYKWFWKQLLRFKKNIKRCLFVIVLTVGANWLCGHYLHGILFQIVGDVATNQALNVEFFKASPVGMLINSAVVAPIIEEIGFRAGMYRLMRKGKFRVIWCALGTGLAFGIVHTLNPVWLIEYTLSGVILCLAYEYSGSIYTSMFAHGIYNTLALLL